MRTALLEDLAALRRHEIVTTTDIRFAKPAPARVEVVTLAIRRHGDLRRNSSPPQTPCGS